MTTGESKGTFWTTLPGILTGLAAVIAAVGTTIGGLAALGVFNNPGGSAGGSIPASASVRAASSPTATPLLSLVSCEGDLETGIWGHMDPSQPTYVAPRDLCVTAFTLYETTSGSGEATVKLDGTTVYSFDLDNFDSIGSEGAGSGERYVQLGGRVIGVGSRHTLSLDFSGCVNCGGLIVDFVASPR